MAARSSIIAVCTEAFKCVLADTSGVTVGRHTREKETMSGYVGNDGSQLTGGLNPSGQAQALSVDASGKLNVNTIIATGFNVIGKLLRASATIVNLGAAAQTTNGNSGTLGVDAYSELAVDINISAVSGTSPTLNLYIDRLGADGNWYTIWSSAQQTGMGQVSASIGAGLATNQAFGNSARLRWVLGGTTPSFTFSASIIAK